MELRIDAPGWIDHEYEDIKCKIKLLSFVEGLKLTDDISRLDGASIFSDIGQAYFKAYVKDFQGLTVNGVKIGSPQELLDAGMGRSGELSELYINVMGKFFQLNTMEDKERKNSSEPPEDEVAKEQTE